MQQISVYKNYDSIIESIRITFNTNMSDLKSAILATILVFLVVLTLGCISHNNPSLTTSRSLKHRFLNFLGSLFVFFCMIAVISLGFSL